MAMHSPPIHNYERYRSDSFRHSGSQGKAGVLAKQLKPFDTQDVRILLLENVNKTGRDALEKQGYQVEVHKSSLPEEELIAKIKFV
jgi:D-3-phosphoglycerate dehydrogenase / 2-oxoglutarate reductase